MNRRDALKSFGAGAALPVVQSTERLELKPDDVIVLKCDMAISREAAARLTVLVQEAMPGRKVLVLDRGIDIKVMRNA